MTIMIPHAAGTRAFAIDWLLDGMAHGRLTPGDADEMLAQLRIVGDVANLERLARALNVAGAAAANGDARRRGFPRGASPTS